MMGLKYTPSKYMSTRICSKCGVEKNLTLKYFRFYKSKNIFLGHCRSCGNARVRELRLNNIEQERLKDRLRCKRRYMSNPDSLERKKNKNKEWRNNNPEKVQEYSERRKRSQRANRIIQNEEWCEVLIKDPCFYCGKLSETIDHLIPLSLGGTDSVINLTGACKSCNSSKKDKTFIEFLIDEQIEYTGV